MTYEVTAGQCYPLGATPDANGTNFAIYSRHATSVTLELYGAPDGPPIASIPLVHQTRFVFHAYVVGIEAGQLYGYRVDGPYEPARGMRFNKHKLLVDPYAKALTGKPVEADNVLLGYDATVAIDPDLSFDARDSGPAMPKSIVVDDDAFDWGDDVRPAIAFENMVIYEVHLKGFTAHPSSGVAADKRGTYLGFAEKIAHLVELGVNVVEFLPLHDRGIAEFLTAKGLTNYWGYDTLSFFAVESAYRASTTPGDEVAEFKTLVRALHRAGIEVILDVVYNHTVEGTELGPTLSLRGVDNATYYALAEGGRRYMNWSGCGNSIDLGTTGAIRLVCDSLRYWAEVMHVDGFRFDLASVLGRAGGDYRSAATFFEVIAQDPILSRVKLIAEPWDLDTYQVGNFPVDWSEWNGKFRDIVRRFEKGDRGCVPELATRIAGSRDLFGDDGRHAYNTINFVTCHDGFTLADLVAYDAKHNEANLEDNRDGTNDNASWNSGVEGPTDDPAILALRRRRAKNVICHLLLSAGTPMLLGGDEMLRTQRGNNNAYCQDSEISWFDWSLRDTNADFFEFVKKAIAFTKRYPVLRRRAFFTGADGNNDSHFDLRWYGFSLDDPPWGDPELRTIAYMLDGGEAHARAGDYLMFVIANASDHPIHMQVPAAGRARRWRRVIDTSLAAPHDFALDTIVPVVPNDHYLVSPRTTVVLLTHV